MLGNVDFWKFLIELLRFLINRRSHRLASTNGFRWKGKMGMEMERKAVGKFS